MEFIAMGFLIGVVFSIVMIGAGALYADHMAKRQHDGGNSVLNSVCVGDRNGRGTERDNKQDNKEG